MARSAGSREGAGEGFGMDKAQLRYQSYSTEPWILLRFRRLGRAGVSITAPAGATEMSVPKDELADHWNYNNIVQVGVYSVCLYIFVLMFLLVVFP
jgi:hypothetical protein